MTGRVEAFSDGVMAIAITLLILEFKVPPGDRDLVASLSSLWGSFAAFLVSFTVIGTYWLQHHRLFRMVGRVDGWLLLLNLPFLMTIAFLPFPTAVLAERLVSGHDVEQAVAFYGIGMFLVALTMTSLMTYVVRSGLLAPWADAPPLRRVTKVAWLSVVTFAVTVGVALVAPLPVLAFYLLIPLYYAIEGARAPQEDPPAGA